jgi:acetoacetyl-CoA synthetase
MSIEIRDENGRAVRGVAGELTCTGPFPCMPVKFWNDPDGEKYRNAYFARDPAVWTHGDWSLVTDHGGVVIFGRSDAVLKPGGVRIGTAEIYRQVEQVEEVLESLAIGLDRDGDTRIVLFVRLRPGVELAPALERRIRDRIRENTSRAHVPWKILAVTDIPRTKSGKIVELAVRDVVNGRPIRNTEALANPEALDQFRGLAALA